MTERRRGEIWLVNFEPQAFSEEPGKRARPALIVQSRMLNAAGHPSTIVVPGTSRVRRERDYFPLRFALASRQRLERETDLLLDQVRAVSNRRFVGESPLALLSASEMARIEAAMGLLLGP